MIIQTAVFTLLLSSCQYLPQLAQSVEDIETDNAIRVEVQKEAMQKDTNIKVTVDVQNEVKQ